MARRAIGAGMVGLLLAAFAAGSGAEPSPYPKLAPHRPGEVLLQFASGASTAATSAILAELGARELRRIGPQSTLLARLTDFSVEQAIARYRGRPSVAWIEPNYIVAADRLPNDPRFGELWGLSNSGQTGGSPGADIDATSAWELFTGSASVRVAVIDTGVDGRHPELAAQLFVNAAETPDNGIDDDGNGYVDDVQGWDFVHDDNDPDDDQGHGTHVAGTIGAVGDNGIGVAGVCWRVELLPLKFLDERGLGTAADAATAIDYAVAMGARVLNNSWGGGGYSETLFQAIRRAGEAGALFVAAAGNSVGQVNIDDFPHYPASYDLPSIVAVAATDHDDALAPFSHYGPQSVDLAAPGVAILSTLPGAGYGQKSGTSMATPHVTGVLALLLGRFPRLQAAEAKALLLERVDRLPALAGLVLSGGRLNAAATLGDADEIAPAAVLDLSAIEADARRLTLRWTASGDDGAVGRARRYDVRYAPTPLDAASFASATPVPGVPVPLPAGGVEQLTLDGLAFDTTYYVALRVFDEHSNGSTLSNVALGTTLGPPDLDAAPAQLDAALATGLLAASTLTLTNRGAGEARYRIGLESDGAPGPSRLRVLLLHSHAEIAGILGALEEFEDLDVAVFDAASASPTAEQLRAHDAVIVVSNLPFPAATALGDLLADHVDEGRGVVLTLASFISGYELQGRLLRGGYLPFRIGVGPIGSGQLGAFDPAHPIMAGVSAAHGGALGLVSLAPGAQPVASWDQGQPFVATQGSHVVGVNVFVGATGYWSGDVPRLLHNAVFWSRGVAWLAALPAAGVVPRGASRQLTIAFDAAGLTGGEYRAGVVVHSDDPERPAIRVPARLHVDSAPDLALAPAALDFGSVVLGASAERVLTLANEGVLALHVAAVLSREGPFAVEPASLVLAPGETGELAVSFRPQEAQVEDAALELHSDDPDEGRLVVPLRGLAEVAPELDWAPARLDLKLVTDGIEARAVTLRNTGGSELVFSVTPVESADTASAASVRGRYVVFDEGFEDNAFEGWIPASSFGGHETTSATAAAGTRFSFHEHDSPGDHLNGVRREFAPFRPTRLSFWVRSGSSATHDGYVVLRASTGEVLLTCFARAGGRFFVNGDESRSYVPRTWYHVELVNLDWTRKTFDYLLDGTLVRRRLAFRNAAAVEDVTELHLYNFTPGSEAWWDEIELSDFSAAARLRVSPAAGRIAPGAEVALSAIFDATGLPPGTYATDLLLLSNDPDESSVRLLTELVVEAPPSTTRRATMAVPTSRACRK